MPQPSSELKVNPSSRAAPSAGNDPLCGFKDGQRVIIFDDTGAYDDMTLTQVQTVRASPAAQQERSLATRCRRSTGAGAQIAQMMQRTYYLQRRDAIS